MYANVRGPQRSRDEERQRYYRSRPWLRRCRLIHHRGQGTCERCRRAPMRHVHHLRYDRLYNERLTDLWGVCVGCHKYLHGFSDIDPRTLPIPAQGVFSFVSQDGPA